jgi:hypothetical protein
LKIDVGILGTVVGNDHLFEQSPEYLPHSINGFVIIEGARGVELRQQIGCPLYGPGHQLREEAHECSEGHEILGGLQLPAIDIDAVAQGLEGVETDAHGQQYLQCRDLQGHAQQGEGRDEVVDEKVEILEETEQSEVDHHAGGQQQLPLSGILFIGKQPSDGEIHQRAERHER